MWTLEDVQFLLLSPWLSFLFPHHCCLCQKQFSLLAHVLRHHFFLPAKFYFLMPRLCLCHIQYVGEYEKRKYSNSVLQPSEVQAIMGGNPKP